MATIKKFSNKVIFKKLCKKAADLSSQILLSLVIGITASFFTYKIISSYIPNIHIKDHIKKKPNNKSPTGYDYYFMIYNKGPRYAQNVLISSSFICNSTSTEKLLKFFGSKENIPEELYIPLAASYFHYLTPFQYASQDTPYYYIKIKLRSNDFKDTFSNKIADGDPKVKLIYANKLEKDFITLEEFFDIFDSLRIIVSAEDEFSTLRKIFFQTFSRENIINYGNMKEVK